MNELIKMFNQEGYIVTFVMLLPLGKKYVEYVLFRDLMDGITEEVYHIVLELGEKIETGPFCARVKNGK
jgi:hypothetical protein